MRWIKVVVFTVFWKIEVINLDDDSSGRTTKNSYSYNVSQK